MGAERWCWWCRGSRPLEADGSCSTCGRPAPPVLAPDELRITPERVRAAYAKTGAQPWRRAWRRDEEGKTPCLCPVAAVVEADPLAGPRLGGAPHTMHGAAAALGVRERYVHGFLSAVDYGDVRFSPGAEPEETKSPSWKQGHEDGLAVARELWPG